MTNYHTKIQNAFSKFSPLCFGVDPSVEIMKNWNLGLNKEDLRIFCDIVLDASAQSVGILKPQSAFFEQFGSDGIYELERFIHKAKELDKVVILDCKRGDIGTTMQAYVKAYIAPNSPFKVDAITITPYLGFEAISSAMELADTQNTGIFVVLRSSNLEASTIQQAKTTDGRTITDYLIDQIVALNKQVDSPIGSIGAVVGATLGQEATDIAQKLFNAYILAPGLGAQGATADDINNIFVGAKSRVIASSSREILNCGSNKDKIKQKLLQYKQDFAQK